MWGYPRKPKQSQHRRELGRCSLSEDTVRNKRTTLRFTVQTRALQAFGLCFLPSRVITPFNNLFWKTFPSSVKEGWIGGKSHKIVHNFYLRERKEFKHLYAFKYTQRIHRPKCLVSEVCEWNPNSNEMCKIPLCSYIINEENSALTAVCGCWNCKFSGGKLDT